MLRSCCTVTGLRCQVLFARSPRARLRALARAPACPHSLHHTDRMPQLSPHSLHQGACPLGPSRGPWARAS
eukprot:5240289-Pyramimonas_sp.AAC.1